MDISSISVARFMRAIRRLRRHAQGYSHHQALRRLSSIGFAPKVIYDIGAHTGKWTELARRTFPTSEFLLFEVNPHLEPALRRVGERYFMAALSDTDGKSRPFHLPDNPDVSTTGGSFYRDPKLAAVGGAIEIQVKTARLDTLQSANALPPPTLIKIDVEGAELEVLGGAGSSLRSCSAIIAELTFVRNDGAPAAHETMKRISELGFLLVDLCKIRRTPLGNVCQIDALFVKRPLYETFRLRA